MQQLGTKTIETHRLILRPFCDDDFDIIYRLYSDPEILRHTPFDAMDPEAAREHLRRGQPFVWNATDLTKETRRRLVGLFERYGARVRIVYLETEWEQRVKRNSARKDAVPEGAIERMLSITVPPLPDEAQAVAWQCT